MDTDYSLPSSTLILIGAAHHRRCLMEKCVGKWRRRLEDLLAKKRRDLVFSSEWHARKLQYLFFRAWQWRFHERNNQRQLAHVAEQHRLRVQLRGWHAAAKKARMSRSTVDRWIAVEQRPQRAHLRQRFEPWMRLSRNRSAVNRMERVLLLATLRRYFVVKWFGYVAKCRTIKQLNALRVRALSTLVGTRCVGLQPAFSMRLALAFHKWMVASAIRTLRRIASLELRFNKLTELSINRRRHGAFRRWFLLSRYRIVARSAARRRASQCLDSWMRFRGQRVSSRLKEFMAKRFYVASLLLRWKSEAERSSLSRSLHQKAHVHETMKRMVSSFAKWKSTWLHRRFIREETQRAVSVVRRDMLERGAIIALLAPVLGLQAAVSAVKSPATSGSAKTQESPDELPVAQRLDFADSTSPPRGTAVASAAPQSDARRRSRTSPKPFRPFIDPVSGVVVGNHKGVSLHADPVHYVDQAHVREDNLRAIVDEYEQLTRTKEADAAAIVRLRNELVSLEAQLAVGTQADRVLIEQQRAVVAADLLRLRNRLQHRLTLRSRIQLFLPHLSNVAKGTAVPPNIASVAHQGSF